MSEADLPKSEVWVEIEFECMLFVLFAGAELDYDLAFLPQMHSLCGAHFVPGMHWGTPSIHSVSGTGGGRGGHSSEKTRVACRQKNAVTLLK